MRLEIITLVMHNETQSLYSRDGLLCKQGA